MGLMKDSMAVCLMKGPESIMSVFKYMVSPLAMGQFHNYNISGLYLIIIATCAYLLCTLVL